MKAVRILFLVTALLAVLQAFYYYPQLPENLASHFDGQGRPNGFMTRGVFLIFHLGVVLLLTFVFLAVPLAIHKLPSRWINLPRKDYWLAPERREATLSDMTVQLTRFGIASLIFLMAVMQITIRANLPGGGARVSPSLLWGLIGVYALYLIVWLVPLLVRYGRPPRESV
ncbi:MAG TPA: DUF1648 domain-containing protein [Planctomycetota bacterium]|nr:DUF1648 domain-containing protein [Planctomycetota bacterium]